MEKKKLVYSEFDNRFLLKTYRKRKLKLAVTLSLNPVVKIPAHDSFKEHNNSLVAVNSFLTFIQDTKAFQNSALYLIKQWPSFAVQFCVSEFVCQDKDQSTVNPHCAEMKEGCEDIRCYQIHVLDNFL